MRITHYLHHVWLSDGGVCRAVLDLCTWQARAGADVTLATFDAKDTPWKAGAPATPRVITLPPHGRLRGVIGSLVTGPFEPILRQTDALHLHDIWDPVQIPMTRLARRLGKPYVQSPHGMLADYSLSCRKLKKGVYRSLAGQRLIDNAAFIVTTAQGELDQSAKQHPRTPGVAIPLVFDTDPYPQCPTPDLARANLKLPATDFPSVMYLSRLDFKKRPDHLLTAGRILRDRGLEFNLVFAGPSDPAYDAKLKAYAAQLGIADITTFLGMVPAEWKPSLFNAMDLFVLPTSMENFGFVYFEALACATPVLTTKGTDTWRELEASGGGRIVDLIRSDTALDEVGPGDVAQLADALADLIKDRARLKAMGRSGREWVLKNMDPVIIAGRYLDLYQRAIDAPPRRR